MIYFYFLSVFCMCIYMHMHAVLMQAKRGHGRLWSYLTWVLGTEPSPLEEQ